MLSFNLLSVLTFLLVIQKSLQLSNFECVNKIPYVCKFKLITEESTAVNVLNGFYNGYYQEVDPVTNVHVTIYLSQINEIKFESSQLQSIPIGIFQRLTSLPSIDFTGIGLKDIKKDDFRFSTSLKVLNMSNNEITQLGNMVFSSLKALTYLNLSRNHIESVHDGAFDECSEELETIDLSHNKLLTLKEDVLLNLQKTVTRYYIKMWLGFNQISTIERTKKTEKIHYNVLSLENNKLSNFDCNNYKVDWLNLKNNNIDSFDGEKCECESLLIGGNHLKEITITEKLIHLDASNNEIESLKIDSMNKSNIQSLNLSKNKIAGNILELVKDMTSLTKLDLSDILIGPLPIDSFANMLSLEELSLKNSGISNINFGTFSHQTNLTRLDISNNNLKNLNLHMFTSLNKLRSFDISGNNLSVLNNLDSIGGTFPLLINIAIHNNNWNCSYLAILVNSFYTNLINVQLPPTSVTNSSHISGIGCTEDSNVKIDLLSDNGNEINDKLNELINKFNQENLIDVKRELEAVKGEIYKTKNDFLQIKSEFIKNQLSNLNSTSSVTINSDIRFMVEHFNNMTVEKQILSTKMLSQQIDKLHFEIEKLRAEKYEVKKSIVSGLKESQQSHNTDNGNLKFVEIMLVIILVCVFLFGVFKSLKYIKSNYGRTSRMMNINKSQCTLQTTFDNTN
ncbi:unnamed protein product [Diamesa tonsa]